LSSVAVAAESRNGALRARGLRKTYRDGQRVVTVLNHIDLELESGALAAIVGPSGSG
jgi:lipoprotein-releasing system ATP-binding protein